MSTKETKHKENEETVTENPQTASETQSADANGQTSKEQTAEERIAALEAENADLQDKYLRKSADFENYRKRMVKEKQEIFDYANTNLLTDLIGILDDFFHSLLETKYDLSVYGEKGDLFDHDKHEAIATNKGPVAEPVCSEVYLKGYMLKDRVIRHAKVMVTTPDGTQKESGASCESDSAQTSDSDSAAE